MLNILAQAEDKSQLDKIVETITDFCTNQGLAFLISLAAALAIYIIGKKIALWISKLVEKACAKSMKDDMIANFLGKLVYTGLLVLVIISALGKLGVNTANFAVILGAAGLAVGMALKDTLGNFASGIMILIFKPFKAGDVINAGGVTAKVTEVQVFATILTTPENQKIIMPNGVVAGGTITNITANDTRRIDIIIGCGYDDDIREVRTKIIEAVQKHEKVHAEPGVNAIITDFGADCINFKVMAWVDTPEWGPTRHDIHEILKDVFDENKFSIPYPQRDVHMHNA